MLPVINANVGKITRYTINSSLRSQLPQRGYEYHSFAELSCGIDLDSCAKWALEKLCSSLVECVTCREELTEHPETAVLRKAFFQGHHQLPLGTWISGGLPSFPDKRPCCA